MAHNCKVKILQPLAGVYPKYQPEVGKIYDAEYRNAFKKYGQWYQAVCVIDIFDKRIALRQGEYEVVRAE